MATAYPFIVEELRRRMTRDATCLEIGCGAKQYRASLSGRYLGLDLATSPYLVEPPELAGSAERIGLPDESVDLVFGVAVFHLIPDASAAFRECRRVLKRGGTLLIFDYQKRELLRLKAAIGVPRHVWSFAELSRLLTEAGFESVGVRDATARIVWSQNGLRGIAKAALYRLGFAGTWLVTEAGP